MGPCPNHPASPAIGACVECERRGCSACLRPSHGELRCVGRCLSHPGSEVASTPAPHVTDKSDVILPAWLSEEEKSNTSILEMSPLKPSPPGSPDGSGLAPEAQPSPESSLDDPGGEISAPPPADEGSIVLVLPDTRRETIQHPCFRHPETPAVVVCGRCARPICSICGADSPEGFACASVCTIQPRRRPVLPVALGALGLAAVIIGGIVLYRWVVPGDSPGLRPSIPAGGERSGPPELAVSPAKPAPLEPPKLEPRPLVSKTPDPAAPPSEPKAEPKPEIRPTAKVDAPPDSKPEPRPEPKPEPKTPVPTAPPVAPAPRPAAPPRPEPKPEVRPAPAAPEPARASPPKPERPTPGPSPQLSPLAQAAG
ncbi:MAG TPA: hypothetical protein VEN81_11230, partial [Planctomycetota bacterium]|nr:hypothetical protein [Planctomycetota bacterium]